MCGIVGIIGKQEDAWIEAAKDTIVHRGPDDFGIYRDRQSNVSLAMRRLSIIDLAGGHQPMSTADGRYTIVFNGEIYNAAELRNELTKSGVTFATDYSDTEVLLQLLVRDGRAALVRLNGMFAFALWDREQGELFCARDRFGIKPLYFVLHMGRLAIASELKSLLVLPWMQKDINLDSVWHYMSLMYVPGTATIIDGINRLPPAGWFLYRPFDQVLEQGIWWAPQIGSGPAIERSEAKVRIRAALEAAVTSWSTADVPIGCSLSGGLDSSAIVGLLASQGLKVKTYSVGFTGYGEEAWNELPLARSVARRWGTEHEEIVLDPSTLLDDLFAMVWHLDEPYGGGLPSWSVFKEMGRSVKVGMTGTGGDELFGNYGKWRELEGGVLQRWLGGPQNDLNSFREMFFDRYYYLPESDKRAYVLSEGTVSADTVAWLHQRYLEATNDTGPRNRIAGLDIGTQLSEEFLMMTDRFSMAHSVEARTPFLDPRLVDLVLGLPAGVRTHRRDLKGLLRESIADLLPPALLRAPKRGFVIPLKLWLRGPLRHMAEQLLASDRLAAQGIFKPEFYARYVKTHLDSSSDYTQVVWAALMFQLWRLIFIEGNGQRPCISTRDFL